MSDLPASDKAAPGVSFKLSLMMFLQYAIWGAWLPILFPFLMGHRGFSLDQTGNILAVGAVGAIVAPFIAGQIADRFFPTQIFLGISHLAGAVLVWFLSDIEQYSTFLWITLVYSLIYAPTISLTNSICFHHLPNRDRDFPRVRLWGTIGWIAAGVTVGHWLAMNHTPEGASEAMQVAAQNAGRADAFKLSAILGIGLGLFCFVLPNTPPSKSEGESNATVAALGQLFSARTLMVLFAIAVPVSIVHQFYFVYTSQFLTEVQVKAGGAGLANSINKILGVGGGGLMTLGQVSEILVMAGVGVVATKVPRKALLLLGLLAYALRMYLFANFPESLPMLIVGILLHGFCFGAFIFVAFMIVDEEFSEDVRASAQSLFNVVIVGVGIIIGSRVSTEIGKRFSDESGAISDWKGLFEVPMYVALACFGLMLLFYRTGPNDPTRKVA
ncbi:MAG: MFS transporter [Planctomycetota bacterium]|jgi:nucleoside transporter